MKRFHIDGRPALPAHALLLGASSMLLLGASSAPLAAGPLLLLLRPARR